MSGNRPNEAWAGGPPTWLVQQWASEQPVHQMASVDLNAREKQASARVDRVLEELARLGNPGLQARDVPGRRHRSLIGRLLPQTAKVIPVSVEAAWPVGTFQWQHRYRGSKELSTGCTPSGRIVPMSWATDGDEVEEALIVWRVGKERSSAGMGRPITAVDLSSALERLVVLHTPA